MLVTDVARPVNPDFEQLVEQTYDAEVEPVNFLEVERTVKHINNKVQNATGGQITDTIDRDDLFKVEFIFPNMYESSFFTEIKNKT
jgi:serine protease inhibitor